MTWLRSIATSTLALVLALSVAFGATLECPSSSTDLASSTCCGTLDCTLGADPSDAGADVSSSMCSAACTAGTALPAGRDAQARDLSSLSFARGEAYFTGRPTPPEPYPPRLFV